MDGLQPQLGEVAPEGALRTHRELSGLADGERIDCCYVVRDRSRRPTKKGGEWLALKLSDRSGSISATDIRGSVIVENDGSGEIDATKIGRDFTVESKGSGSIQYREVSGRVDIPSRHRQRDRDENR